MTEAFKNINPFILGLLISLGIGLILGLEREYDKLKEEQGFAGIRTFPIVAIIGFILGNLSTTYTPWLVIIIAAAFLLFLSLSHLSIVQKHIMTGITTNMALFATLILGVMVGFFYYNLLRFAFYCFLLFLLVVNKLFIINYFTNWRVHFR